MTDLERTKLGVYETVSTLLSENKDVIANIRSFNFTLNKLKRIIEEIKRQEKVVSSETLERAISSANAREDLVRQVVFVRTNLFNFAKEKEKIEIKEKARNGQSLLMRLKDHELIDRASWVSIFARKYLLNAKKFKVSAADLKLLDEKIRIFKESLASKISGLILGHSFEEMNILFEGADTILVQMDNLIEFLEDSNDELYDDYMEARDIQNQDQKKFLMELEEEEWE